MENSNRNERVQKRSRKVLFAAGIIGLVAGGIAIYYLNPKLKGIPFKKLINKKKRSNNVNAKNILKLKNINLTEYKTRKDSEFIKEISEKYCQGYESKFNGKGIFAKEMAEKLGVTCKTTDSPNVRLLNIIVNKVGDKPTGYKYKTQETYNNGGTGYRLFKTNLYSKKTLLKVKEYIEKNSKKIKNENDLYECEGIPYKYKSHDSN